MDGNMSQQFQQENSEMDLDWVFQGSNHHLAAGQVNDTVSFDSSGAPAVGLITGQANYALGMAPSGFPNNFQAMVQSPGIWSDSTGLHNPQWNDQSTQARYVDPRLLTNNTINKAVRPLAQVNTGLPDYQNALNLQQSTQPPCQHSYNHTLTLSVPVGAEPVGYLPEASDQFLCELDESRQLPGQGLHYNQSNLPSFDLGEILLGNGSDIAVPDVLNSQTSIQYPGRVTSSQLSQNNLAPFNQGDISLLSGQGNALVPHVLNNQASIQYPGLVLNNQLHQNNFLLNGSSPLARQGNPTQNNPTLAQDSQAQAQPTAAPVSAAPSATSTATTTATTTPSAPTSAAVNSRIGAPCRPFSCNRCRKDKFACVKVVGAPADSRCVRCATKGADCVWSGKDSRTRATNSAKLDSMLEGYAHMAREIATLIACHRNSELLEMLREWRAQDASRDTFDMLKKLSGAMNAGQLAAVPGVPAKITAIDNVRSTRTDRRVKSIRAHREKAERVCVRYLCSMLDLVTRLQKNVYHPGDIDVEALQAANFPIVEIFDHLAQGGWKIGDKDQEVDKKDLTPAKHAARLEKLRKHGFLLGADRRYTTVWDAKVHDALAAIEEDDVAPFEGGRMLF
ncbi:hypothetical protein Micbo1qcDRAFT_179735 [Microdochium bolleyi]|uniref:Zn(2)-C6 fungal-type domain-containing protein n=1 Tax=Microdochium bolleyi TaxID=196109 RepID=A0A136IPC3_9PEZI|nr:hypothetical protein Micbo1qcDRAFT_179735 [Microdochium bolleyi]